MDYGKVFFRKVKDLLIQEDNNATALLQQNGDLGYINEVGSLLWRNCEGKNIEQLYEVLLKECRDLNEIPVTEVKKDIEEFMNKLYSCGYVFKEGEGECVV